MDVPGGLVMLITDVLHDGWIYWISIWCNNVLSVRSLCMNLSCDTEELEIFVRMIKVDVFMWKPMDLGM